MEFPEDKNRAQILHLQGNPFEMGKAHGFLLANKIKSFYSAYFSPIAAMFGGWIPGLGDPPSIHQMNIGRKNILRLAEERTIPAIKEQEPEYWNELEGLFEGLKLANSPLTWEDVLVGNSMPEASWIFPQCSNFAAWDKATVDGKLIHGVNLDEETFGVMQDYVEIMIVRPDDGNSFLGMHLMGNISPNSWMNDKGLSYGEMTCNSVNVKWPQIPHLMHGRKVAQHASTIKEANTILGKTGGTTGWANLISEGKNKTPHAADIELTGTEITIRYEDPEFENVIWLTNTFRCYPGNQGYNGYNMVKGQIDYWEKSEKTSFPDYIDPSIKWDDVDTLEKWQMKVKCPRYEKYSELLKNNYGKINVEKAIEFQSDEVLTMDRMPGKIQLAPPCEHFYGKMRPIYSYKVFSVYSCVFVPRDGLAWIASGETPAQKGPFCRLCLPDHLKLMNKYN
jgi:hypothetical protein